MDQPLHRDLFVWATGSMCALNRIPFDVDLLQKRYPPPYNISSLQGAFKAYGLKVSLQSFALEDVHPATFPLLAILKPEYEKRLDGIETQRSDIEVNPPASLNIGNNIIKDAIPNSSSTPAVCQLAIVLKSDRESVLIVLPLESKPQTISLEKFKQLSTGEFILLRMQSQKPSEDSHEVTNKLSSKNKQEKFDFRWFVPELMKHKKIWREILLASLAIQLVALATPLCTQIIIDKVVVHHTTSTLIVIAVAMGIFLVFNASMGWIRQYLILHTGNRMDAVIGYKVFSHMLHLPMRYFDNRPTGTLVARLHGVETIREFLAGSLITLILDLPFLFVFLAIMFWYSWQLSLIAVSSLILIVSLSLVITPIFRKKLNHQFLLGARNQSFLTEYVSGMETVKTLQLESQLEKKYGEYLATYLSSTFESRQLSNTYNTIANTLDQLQTLCILCLGAWIVMHTPEFTIGMLVAFQMFSGRLSGPVLRLVGMWQEFQQADIAVKRLGDLMNAPIEPYSLIPINSSSIQGSIELENISFRYSEQLPWLYRSLSLKIKPNKCTVIMGPSGSGKSTLAKLLLGFQHPQEGSIKLDGRDISYFSANELRNVFGVVPQETTLFAGTLYDNFMLANPHATFEQIIKSCQLAGIHETIEKLPHAYQTEIGEHGTGLSGGQKQRISIARALLKQPKILIFDESISNLDQHTSEQFALTINRLKGKVTVIFITHQIPKSLNVDEAILLGKAEEPSTTHADSTNHVKAED